MQQCGEKLGAGAAEGMPQRDPPAIDVDLRRIELQVADAGDCLRGKGFIQLDQVHLERFAEVQGPEWDRLAEHSVGEAMTPSLCSVAPFVDIYTAAEYMVRAGVHRLIVMDDGRLAGVLSSMDIVRAVAEQRLVAAGPEVQSGPRKWADVRR